VCHVLFLDVLMMRLIFFSYGALDFLFLDLGQGSLPLDVLQSSQLYAFD